MKRSMTNIFSDLEELKDFQENSFDESCTKKTFLVKHFLAAWKSDLTFSWGGVQWQD